MDNNIPTHPSFRPSHARPLQPHTLPPLPQQAFHSHPGSAPHTPVTPSTPHSFTPANGFPSLPPQQDRGMPPPPPFSQPVSLMALTQPLMPTSGAVTSSQTMPSAVSTSRLPDLLPAPQGGFSSQRPLPPFNFGQQHQLLPQQSLQSPTEPPPTHVVGSQGRRGVLPSAPGRPVALPGSAVAGKTQPQKNKDGKYPCEHCQKTYLHLKHLKRHMLRRMLNFKTLEENTNHRQIPATVLMNVISAKTRFLVATS